MFDRSELKQRAKFELRKYYWWALLVTFIMFVLGGGINQGYIQSFPNNHINRNDIFGYGQFHTLLPLLLPILFFIICFALTAGLAYRIFVVNIFMTGKSKFFIAAAEGDMTIGHIVFAFKNGKYMKVVAAMAWQTLFLFLWSLVPVMGIVKYYSYFFVPYIMAENPDTNYKDALLLSIKMSKGNKWAMFVLDLSFLGWAILGLLCCCVGILFLMPYVAATRAQLYFALKQRINEGGFVVTEPTPQVSET